MHVLMLGWEFPPFIAGGLGTACHGLTKALDRHGTHVTFVLPKPIDRSHSSHVNLLSPSPPAVAEAPPNEALARALDESAATGGALHVPAAAAAPAMPTTTAAPAGSQAFANVRFLGVPAGFVSPYQRSAGNQPVGRWVIRGGVRRALGEHEGLEGFHDGSPKGEVGGLA